MSEQRIMRSFEELRYSDDFMFGKVMEDKGLCREVLECLLQRPVGEITRKIDEAVVNARKNETWWVQYMKERIVLQEAREEGQTEILNLNKWLFDRKRDDDVRKATEDPVYMEALLAEYRADMGTSGEQRMSY